MKRFLRWSIDFLERKFPDQVVVRQSDYDLLHQAEAAHGVEILALQERLKAVETNLANVNAAMGMSIPKLGMLER